MLYFSCVYSPWWHFGDLQMRNIVLFPLDFLSAGKDIVVLFYSVLLLNFGSMCLFCTYWDGSKHVYWLSETKAFQRDSRCVFSCVNSQGTRSVSCETLAGSGQLPHLPHSKQNATKDEARICGAGNAKTLSHCTHPNLPFQTRSLCDRCLLPRIFQTELNERVISFSWLDVPCAMTRV